MHMCIASTNRLTVGSYSPAQLYDLPPGKLRCTHSHALTYKAGLPMDRRVAGHRAMALIMSTIMILHLRQLMQA